MTKFTVTLESESDETKHGAYVIYGEIAIACESLTGLRLVEITDDTASVAAKATKRKYVRKAAAPAPNGTEPNQLDIEHDALT